MTGSDGQLWRHSTAPATNKSGQPDPLSTALHEESFVSEFAAVTTLHPDIRRGRRPPEPRGYGLRGCYASRLLQRPSPRRPRKRSLPRLARSHSPNPHLRRWIFPANLPIAVPGSAYVLQEQMPRFRLSSGTRFSRVPLVFAPGDFLLARAFVFTAAFFNAGFFFKFFFVAFFLIGLRFFAAVFFSFAGFFLVFFLAAIGEVYHRSIRALKAEKCITLFRFKEAIVVAGGVRMSITSVIFTWRCSPVCRSILGAPANSTGPIPRPELESAIRCLPSAVPKY